MLCSVRNPCDEETEECFDSSFGPRCTCRRGFVLNAQNVCVGTCANANPCTRPNEECADSVSGQTCRCTAKFIRNQAGLCLGIGQYMCAYIIRNLRQIQMSFSN